MADERPGQRPAEAPPAVVADERLRTGAGTPVTIRLLITNRAGEPRSMSVTALGVDASWLPPPSRSQPLGPGESITADLTLNPAPGTVPARYPLAIAVQAIDPATDEAVSPTQLVEVDLVVDAPGLIAVGLEPVDATAVFGKRIAVSLHNTGTEPVPVHLEIKAPQSTQVSTAASDVDVPPGQVVRVPGRIKVRHPQLFGPRARHTYTVTARSAGSPRHVEGSLTARAMFGPGGTKVGVLLAVVALWVAAALIFIPKLADRVRTKEAAGPSTAVTTTVSPGGSSSPASPGGSGQPGSPGGSGTAVPGGPGAAGATTVQLNGTVTGDAPGDVTVSLRPTSLVDEQAVGAVPVGVTTQAGAVGKIWGSAVTVLPPTTVSPERGAVTGEDGAWSFAGVSAPGYYLLTFAKPGYQTQRYVLDSSTTVATQPLKVSLTPGQGRLSGTVSSPSGPVGAAQITITDGINTITTSSNSKGVVGAWSVVGLSTPSTYLVTASKNGLSTESRLVPLAAGGTGQVPLSLSRGVASLVGKVSGVNSLGVLGGLGGVQVTATDGTLTRTATTVTSGPVGSYTLADLPPATYTVTVQAQGYVPQTQRVTLVKGRSNATVNAVLTSSSATVAGRVSSAGQPLNGAGLVLSSPTESYKITSTADGSFGFTGVAPGTFVLSAEYFGYATGFATVKAVAGQAANASLALVPQTVTSISWITGFVGSATSPGNTLCPKDPTQCEVLFTLYAASAPTTPLLIGSSQGGPFASPMVAQPAASGPTGYTIYGQGGLASGLYRLTIAVRATGGVASYLPATVRVQVPRNGEARAPQVNLFPTNSIGGTISALGSLTTDGVGNTYTNCVYAVPIGEAPPDLTKCVAPTTTSQCLIDGTVDLGYAQIGAVTDNVYNITDLCDGTYEVFLVITNPDYVTPAPLATETVSHGQTVNYSPHVFRKGRVIITFYEDKNGTVVRHTTALDGTASCGPPTSDVIPLDDPLKVVNGQVTVTGVTSGTVTCTVTPGASGLGGATTNVSVSNDMDTPINLTLTQAVGSFWGRVVSTYGTGGSTPVEGAHVSIDGITGYDGTTPTSTSTTVVTDANGCFAITPTGGVAYVSGTVACGTIAAGSTNAAEMRLLSTSINVGIPTPPAGYRAIAVARATVASGTIPQLTLVPNPVPANGLSLVVTTVSGTPPSPASATISVNKTGAPGSGTVRVTADAVTGALIWTDSNFGGDAGAWPGTYILTASLDGYTSDTATVTCAFNDTCTFTGGDTLTLIQKGALSGSILAVLGLRPADLSLPITSPTQPLVGAQVKAELCQETGPTQPATCTPVSGVSFTVQSGVNGQYTVTTSTSASVYVLPLGWYKVTVSSNGYTTDSTIVSITSGANTATIGPTPGQIALFITPTSIDIGVVTATNPSKPPVKADLSSTATVTMKRIDTLETFTGVIDTATNLYRFADLIPTTYQVTISGTGLVQTVNYISLPYATTPPTIKAYYFNAGIAQNAVSGSVHGLQGGATSPTGLNGVTVDVGTVTGGNFHISKGTDNNDLTTTTASAGGVEGAFSFTTIKDGTYSLRFRDKYGYGDTLGPSQVILTGGQFVAYPTVVLTRVTQKVTVTVATSTGNNPSGWAAAIANVDTPSWTLTADSSPSGAAPYRWVFNQVPFGCWAFGLTLPSGHYGSLSLTTTPPTDPTNVPCATGNFTVKGTGTTEVTPGYTLDERQLDITVTATPVDSHTVPTVAHVKVTAQGAADPIYEVNTFTIGSGGTSTLWLPNATYDLFAEPADTTTFPPSLWPSVTTTGVTLSDTAPTSRTLALAEVAVQLTVTLDPTDPQALVTVTPGPGQTLPVPSEYASGVTTVGGVATLLLPVGSWTLTATVEGQPASPPETVTLVAGTPASVTLSPPSPTPTPTPTPT